jgi:hypothetical protein
MYYQINIVQRNSSVVTIATDSGNTNPINTVIAENSISSEKSGNNNIELATLEEKYKARINSKNLRQCYYSYHKAMRLDNGKTDKLRKIFTENDVEIWMSGLICSISSDCIKETVYFLDSKGGMKKNDNNVTKNSVFNFDLTSSSKDNCAPGCGCDNPWAFLS